MEPGGQVRHADDEQRLRRKHRQNGGKQTKGGSKK